ncbi:hypothetical protein PM025_17300 [Halorubrum ezzemoulense]|uniref:hypothetical protein n=1 Tax=Halorubrum ezzemoulense TaxID=337243 RepID=UPI00111BD6E5|nr:hypothetical protein [Halorubrum ezzemoulense]MDB2265835.1 hypothetical protein [Halorubrum ezzemoulense]
MVQLEGENIEVEAETDSGWPTIITLESDGHPAGIAVDYLGMWHGRNVGMEEVDLLLIYENGEWRWRAIVAFSTEQDAIERGQYEADGYNGYKLVPWNTDDRFDQMEELLDEDITPIVYDQDYPTNAAHVMQKADSIHTLNRILGIGQLKTLTKRRKQLFTKIVPRSVRWENKENSLQELARDVVDNRRDTPQPADEPYQEGDDVQVNLGSADPNNPYDGETGKVINVLQEGFDGEAEHEVDAYSYKIEIAGEVPITWFRHRELVPT